VCEMPSGKRLDAGWFEEISENRAVFMVRGGAGSAAAGSSAGPPASALIPIGVRDANRP
jgi:hypothetical protein